MNKIDFLLENYMHIYKKKRTIVKGIVDKWRAKQEFVADDKVNDCDQGQSEGLWPRSKQGRPHHPK